MREAVIVAATRTPVGKRNGVFAEVRADDLAADVLEEVVPEVRYQYVLCGLFQLHENRNERRFSYGFQEYIDVRIACGAFGRCACTFAGPSFEQRYSGQEYFQKYFA